MTQMKIFKNSFTNYVEIIKKFKWRYLIGVILPTYLAGVAAPFCGDIISQIVTAIVGGISSYLTWISILDLDKSINQNELTHRLRTYLEGARNGNKELYNALIKINYQFCTQKPETTHNQQHLIRRNMPEKPIHHQQ